MHIHHSLNISDLFKMQINAIKSDFIDFCFIFWKKTHNNEYLIWAFITTDWSKWIIKIKVKLWANEDYTQGTEPRNRLLLIEQSVACCYVDAKLVEWRVQRSIENVGEQWVDSAAGDQSDQRNHHHQPRSAAPVNRWFISVLHTIKIPLSRASLIWMMIGDITD